MKYENINKDGIVNRDLTYLHEGSLEITLTDPLSIKLPGVLRGGGEPLPHPVGLTYICIYE